MTAAQPPDDSALGRPPHPPSPVRNPIRQMFMVNDVQNRWPFALRAAACMAVPALIGWLAGDLASGLMATIGAFTSLYASGRPYLNRGVHLGVVAVCFALAVALGNWAAEVPWAGVLTVSVIAMAAVLVCNALAVGPPGAYMFVLACATGTGVASEHLAPWRIGLLVLAGGGFAWLVHMFGALINVRGPEKSAVVSAAEEVARFADAVGTSSEAPARHSAASALHQSWNVLVTFQPVHPRPSSTLHALRALNHELHVVFAEVMTAAGKHESPPHDAEQRAHALGLLADSPANSHQAPDIDEMPLGRPAPFELLRQSVTPGSPTLSVVARAGVAVCVAGFIASTLGIDHAYWAMSAAVLIVHQGFDWIRTLQRGAERTLGTGIGLALAGALLALHPHGLWLVATIALLQFTVELVVVRNYAIAVVFITPLALTMSSGGQPVDDIDDLLLARGIDTLIGCVVAFAVYLLIGRRHNAARLPEAIARTLDAIAATSRHLALGAVRTVAARTARRDLQIRAMAMLEAHDGGLGGSARERRSAERMWPAVVAIEQLAYRTLAACWAMERGGGGVSAPEGGLSLFGPSGVARFTTLLDELSTAIQTGSAPPRLDQLPPFGAAEITTVRDSLVREIY